jgi:cytidylate kinase
MAVIAMTREMATLGKDVASGLAERLGLTVVHHELVEQGIAERAGMLESEVHRFLERDVPLLERWKIDRKRLSRYTAREIFELAARGNVLVRGWGAAYLLHTIPHVVCVRICAPMTFREQVLMQRLGIEDRQAARQEILRNDAAHNGTMQKFFGIDWADPALYSIVLNTARVPVPDCVEHIAQLAQSRSFQETPESRTLLQDAVLAARVREVLEERFGSNLGGIDPIVVGGKVTLTGGFSDERVIVDVVRSIHKVEGVKGVESQIKVIGFHTSS